MNFNILLLKKWIRFSEGSWNHEYLGLLQSKWSPKKAFALALQETQSIHDSMNLQKIEFFANIYILYI